MDYERIAKSCLRSISFLGYCLLAEIDREKALQLSQELQPWLFKVIQEVAEMTLETEKEGQLARGEHDELS